jgi:predicted dehydrogenase
MARPRFGVIGCGSIGKRHMKNLLALGESAVLGFDPRPDRRAEVEALGISTTAELEALLDAQPQAVLVTSPSKLHVEHALAAAERGIALFIEKPVSDDHGRDLDRLIETIASRKLVSLVGCNLRFHPGLRRAKQVLDEGRLGRVVSIRAEFGQYLPDWHPWEDYRQGYSARRDLGGGVILDAIHELDYVRWLMGDVAEIAAVAGRLSRLEIDTEDTALLIMRFASGAAGEIHLDYVQRAYTRSCRIIGDEGTLAWDFGEGGDVRVYEASTRRWDKMKRPPDWDVNAMYLDEMRHFLDCLEGKEPSMQDVSSATAVLDLALAAKRSSDQSMFVSPGRPTTTGEPSS